MAKNNGKTIKQTPAEAVFAIFNGAPQLARKLKYKNRSTVYRWNMPVSRRGTGGRIPSKAQREILKLARREGKHEVTPELLLNGRSISAAAA